MVSTAGEIGLAGGDVHAAIDIGTNSFHLVVARALADGGFEVITTEKEMVRLGQGSGEMKRLTPEAVDRGVAALSRMAGVAASHGATVTAVATSATREAKNRAEFLDRVRDETGIEIEVISGFEEARLIHLGVLQALPVFDKRLLLVDIGGGSTEFLVGEGETVLAARSLKLGAIRITERFFPDGEVRPKLVRKARAWIRSTLAAAVHELGQHRFDVAIGSSGTITAIASMIAAERGTVPKDMNGVSFTGTELARLVARLVELSPAERREVEGMDSRRADIIVGGALLLSEAFAAFGVDAMTVSGYALREGVLFDRMVVPGGSARSHLTDLRRTNVRRLARQLDPDAAHAETAAALALRLFDQTVELHWFGPRERELLELAALVHNVGLFISHAAHHKHTYYVVRHSEQLTGFTERERELLALVARYHRKSHPNTKHPEFAELGRDDREMVRTLAGMLRVAIGLDRTHRALVDDIEVTTVDADGAPVDADGAERLVITVVAEPGADVTLEAYSAQERADLLADVLDLDVEVTVDLEVAAVVADNEGGGR
ncbi:MAG: Ppx/GppA phosphatase family protein [Actinomycetota bacterium]